MNRLTRVLLAVFLMAMSQTMCRTFSEVCGMEVLSGPVELRETDQMITAMARRDNQVWEVRCRWAVGRPEWIAFKLVGEEL